MINKSNYNYAEIRERHDLIMKEGFIKFIDLDGELFLFIVHFSDYLNQFKRIISKKRIKAINNTSLIFYHTIKAMSCYHGGCYKKSFLQAYQIKNIIKECVGNPLVIFYYFYFFLSSLELFKRSSFYKKPYYLWKIWSVYKELNFWNKTCPENFSYYVYIMKAGFLDIVGLYKLASKKYDQAIAISKQDQFLLDEALANELAAKFHLENDQEKIASSYMAEARNLYQRWGADAKIKFLEARYPDLLHPIMKENKNSSLNYLIENMLSTQNVISLENESLFESNQKAQQRIQQHQTEIAHYARVNTLSELATGLAHEINQPLASSLNYLGGCLERLKSSETSPDIIAGVEKASTGIERAGEIIQHLRASIKKQDITKTMINLNEVINHVLPLLNYKIKSSQTELTLNLSNTLPNVLADKLQIEQVLINLINNALEALQEVNINKRKLIITTQQNQSHIEIKIKDTGKGIDPNIQEKLFQPFMTTKPEGLGMGLAICKTIIETYSGHIQAQRLEDGTELSVVIPVPSYSPNS